MKVTNINMLEALDKFDRRYSYPIYATVCDMSSFFSSRRRQRMAFAAISDHDELLLVQYPFFGLGDPIYLDFSSLSLVKAKFSKLFGTHRIQLIFRVDGKKQRYDLTIAKKVVTTDLYEQDQNLYGFIDTLRKWAAYV